MEHSNLYKEIQERNSQRKLDAFEEGISFVLSCIMLFIIIDLILLK